MSMGADELLIRAALKDELTGPLEGIRDELRRTATETSKAGAKANIGARGFDKMAAGATRFVRAGVGAAARVAAAGVAALTAAAVAGSIKVLSLASDAAETASAFSTVFKGVSGNVSGYVRRMNKEFGLTTAELQTAATTFGVFGKAAGVSRRDLGGFTKDLVGAGMDLSSFYNADPSEVFLALKSGLAGEAEPLRQFGIFLSDASMKAEAAQAGLTGELTESQKVMLRQRIIMKSLGDAEGDLARTKDGLANKTKALKGRLTEAATTIGTAMLPAANKLVTALEHKAGRAVTWLKDNLGQLQTKISRGASALGAAGQQIAGGHWGKAAGTIDKATGSGGKLVEKFRAAKGIAKDVATVITGVLVPSFNDAAGATGGLSSPLGMLRSALGWAADNTGLVRAGLTTLIVVLTAAKIVSLGMAAATKAKAAADAIALINLKAHTVGTKTHLVVSKAAAVGTKVWAAGQWLLNAALTANPIGIIVVAIGALIAGLVLAYNKSETFRGAVQTVWEWLKKFAGFTPLGALIANFDDVRDAVGWVIDKVESLIGWIGKIKMPDLGSMVPDLNPFGDTRSSRARGGAGLGQTLATHARTAAATGARPTITNALVGGGGRGYGSGDHQAGRALDLTGKGLAKYGRAIRADGGYAAFHGSGRARHLHAVPAGDTSRSMARSIRTRSTGPAGGGTTLVVQPGGITVDARGASSDVDVAQAVTDGIAAYVRDREERS